jgi:hypothetical protein
MKVFEFEDKMSKKYGGKMNIINDTNKGFYVTTITDRNHKMDVKFGKIVFYKTVESLKRNSKSFTKSYPTILVKMNGSDYAKATVTEI